MEKNIIKNTTSLSVWSDEDKVREIKKIYGEGLTDGEFMTFCEIGRATGLNPFMRELWAVKYDKSKPANIFIGRDGYRKVAQSQKDYDWHFVDIVCENDQFSVSNGEVSHTYTTSNRGKVLGAYCVVKRKSSSKAIYNFVDIEEYNLGHSLWKTKPKTMIKKVAERQGLCGSFQEVFAGTYDEAEYWEERAVESKEERKQDRADILNAARGRIDQEPVVTQNEDSVFDMTIKAIEEAQTIQQINSLISRANSSERLTEEQKADICATATDREKALLSAGVEKNTEEFYMFWSRIENATDRTNLDQTLVAMAVSKSLKDEERERLKELSESKKKTLK